MLQYQRESLARKVADVSDADARGPLVGSGTSLLWLIRHMARAEMLWVVYRFAGKSIQLPVDGVRPSDVLADAVRTYRSGWERVDAVVAASPSLDALCARSDGQTRVNLRWVLTHLLEETARHAGHADILRELLDGTTGR
ncbi:MAG TPA: DinB family protein [Jatrophihabitans sp.]